ncbi:MAG: hypothetical protein ACPHK8_01035 [Thermoplasmatota archaeon]
MKPWLVVLLLIPMLPMATAQDNLQEVSLDPAGDMEGYVNANGAVLNIPAPPGRYQTTDLLGLYVQEQRDTIHFQLEVASLQPTDLVPVLEDAQYFVGFTHNDQPFVAILTFTYTDQEYAWGTLVKQDIDQGGYDFITPLTVTWEGNRLLFDLEREDLTDTNGAAPYPGRELTRFFAQSHLASRDGLLNVNNIPIGSQWDTVDNLPDGGPNDFTLPILIGLQQRGHASLISPDPMRASNGEATTFVYVLDATNSWDRADQFDITLENIPDGWDVVLQDPIIHLEAGETKQIPILLSIPFLHQHGIVEVFDVKMASHWDNSLGHAQLGVRFHEVPQPAGHHNEIFFHSQRYGEVTSLTGPGDILLSGSIGNAYFNTLEEDPENDDKIEVTGNYWGWGYHNGFPGDVVPQALWRWQMFLQPGLEMGLDFDLSGEGTATFPFATTLPVPGAVLAGELFHWGYDPETQAWTRTVIAQMDTGAPRDFTGPETFQFTFPIEAEADEIPYLKDAFLGMNWNLTSTRPSGFTGIEAPRLLPGGTMTLPMFEYTDPVDEVFPELGAARIRMQSDLERAVNPGRSIIFEGELMNHQDTEDQFTFSHVGVNKDWVTGLPAAPVKLGSNEAYPFQLLITVPEDAADGELADIVLTAKGQSDARALVRLVANVDTSTNIPDEGHLKTDEVEESPAAPVLFAMVALAALAMLRRRA